MWMCFHKQCKTQFCEKPPMKTTSDPKMINHRLNSEYFFFLQLIRSARFEQLMIVTSYLLFTKVKRPIHLYKTRSINETKVTQLTACILLSSATESLSVSLFLLSFLSASLTVSSDLFSMESLFRFSLLASSSRFLWWEMMVPLAGIVNWKRICFWNDHMRCHFGKIKGGRV